jgi:hypothetical protein
MWPPLINVVSYKGQTNHVISSRLPRWVFKIHITTEQVQCRLVSPWFEQTWYHRNLYKSLTCRHYDCYSSLKLTVLLHETNNIHCLFTISNLTWLLLSNIRKCTNSFCIAHAHTHTHTHTHKHTHTHTHAHTAHELHLVFTQLTSIICNQ